MKLSLLILEQIKAWQNQSITFWSPPQDLWDTTLLQIHQVAKSGSMVSKSILGIWWKVSILKNPDNSTFYHGFPGLHVPSVVQLMGL
jgi:hypothetical protein